MNMTKKTIKNVEWRLWALMADRGIRSASELSELMQSKAGHEISNTQMSRYTKANPPALTLKMIASLLTTLDAKTDELFRVTEIEVEVKEPKTEHAELKLEIERRNRIKGDQPEPPPKPSTTGPKLFRLNTNQAIKKK